MALKGHVLQLRQFSAMHTGVEAEPQIWLLVWARTYNRGHTADVKAWSVLCAVIDWLLSVQSLIYMWFTLRHQCWFGRGINMAARRLCLMVQRRKLLSLSSHLHTNAADLGYFSVQVYFNNEHDRNAASQKKSQRSRFRLLLQNTQ